MRSPSELPLFRILHIKTLSAALSMLHSINYGTLSSCGSNGMGYCILEEKMATTTSSWMGLDTSQRNTPIHRAIAQGRSGDGCGGESWLSKTRNMPRTPLRHPEHSTSTKVVMKEQKVWAGNRGSGHWGCGSPTTRAPHLCHAWAFPGSVMPGSHPRRDINIIIKC